jgi:SOS-response transcriptional repressor LexA
MLLTDLQADLLLKRIASELKNIPLDTFSKAEHNIFKLLVENDYMCKAEINGDYVAKEV